MHQLLIPAMNFVVFFQHNTHACHDLEANPPEIRGSKHKYLLCSKSGEFFEIRPQHPITRALVLVLPVLNFHLPVRPTDAASRTEHNSRNYKMQAMRNNSNICL